MHPYREGNGRTIREFIRELALKNNYIFDISKIPPSKFLDASMKSIVDTKDLENIIYKCLEECS